MAQRRMLTEQDRAEISRGVVAGVAGPVIAARIGGCPSVVSREISRDGGRDSYRAVAACLPAGRRDATTTCDALITTITGMPSQLVETLTWDQGSEMAAHAAFSLATEVPVDFAHPHSPWERGTNDNTNGLLREYFLKGTDITDDQTYLDRVAD